MGTMRNKDALEALGYVAAILRDLSARDGKGVSDDARMLADYVYRSRYFTRGDVQALAEKDLAARGETPAPKPKRGRGRPRKYPKKEES